MLSYRHSYHAGNFADVLKHSVLIHILEHLNKKQKPFCYVDTHAGAGNYSLVSEQAEKTQEYQQGIGALWQKSEQADHAPAAIINYMNVIKAFNTQDELTRYPGSPMIARHLMRSQDRLFLYELHNTEIELLRQSVNKDKRVQIAHEDGFKRCISNMPPQQRRGLVLIDPSYEMKTDYKQVIETLEQLYKRFTTGIYALWYPVVERLRIDELEQKILSSSLQNVQLFELGQLADSQALGMTASGMIVINPPWTLKTEMQKALPYLAEQLGIANQGYYRIKQLKDE
ncbi:rRNA methyltransferase [Methyloprofundus sedimenti]|uniref:Ribosomal RNA large subunit methyltransferase J n=1 Tax=Methyloprofundus sedimenti TaxID=1420851 RepID=A0A1V8M125_9GAMM|nr:23S rRNA (adenine(2030)-N(6))-methyltransferase RlmJ [Methyloprofundus sedimenti]OQK15261.1 rRNA methyltransferase [Methyloprofundus sedimenti]